MPSKYIDKTAVMQVIGTVFTHPEYLDYTDKYTIVDEDFSDEFHRIIFGAIYKIHALGSTAISLTSISDFLSERPKSMAVYKNGNGEKWLTSVVQTCDPAAFDYYYSRLKKFSLLRAYDNCGIDVSDIYDIDNILDIKKKQFQEDQLDNSSLIEIADKVDAKIDQIRADYVDDTFDSTRTAGEGIFELIQRFKDVPEAGVPLYGTLINTITRGARLKKFYLRSAATGVGKTRSMIADCCYIGCNYIYDDVFGWMPNGVAEPVLYITTEQELEEVQTMMLAFISNVNEEHIISAKYEGDEEDRVKQAAHYLRASPIYIRELPDFSLRDIEDTIKRSIREFNVKYIFHDYIHTSMKILEEIKTRSGGINLREDNVLFMLSNKLKDICNQYGVFIESATQLNGDWKDAQIPDQNLLRGAKSIADKIDYGSILLSVTNEDIQALSPILDTGRFDKPTIKMSIYKNRRGRYKGILLWCKADLGTCRIDPMFATSYDYDLLSIEDLKINVIDTKELF